MDANGILSFLTSVELTFWLLAFATAIYSGLYKHYSAVVSFLGIKLLLVGTYSCISLYSPSGIAGSAWAYRLFFEVFWPASFLATLSVFFSIEQIMARVLSPLPGVSRLSIIIFRFTGILTFFIACTAHLPEARRLPFGAWMTSFFISVALCMCVFEVTLMSLLIGVASRLGLSFRTRILGLGLGLCFLGVNDFLSLALSIARRSTSWAGLSLTNELVVDVTLVMWITYFMLPDKKRGPLRLNRSSSLMRWNDIVNQLGLGPQPVVELAPSFMTDVESVVERIMLRNPGRKI